VNEHQLRSFISTAEKGSFSKAAKDSFITTSALVQQINLLEHSMGFKLFARKRTGVELTEAGNRFYGVAQEIIETLEEIRQIGSMIESKKEYVLNIGCEDNEMADYFFPISTILLKRHPNVDVNFVPTPYDSQLTTLMEGKSDLFVAPEYLHRGCDGLIFQPLYTDSYYCCMAPDHPLSNKETIELGDLAAEKVFMEEKAYAPGAPLNELLDYIEIGNIDHTPYAISLPMKIMLDKGVIPRAKKCMISCVPPLVGIPLACSPEIIGITYRNNSPEPALWFIEAAKEHFAGGFPSN
jgi:DNA-binding transcriptional LysR family regulator